MYDVIPLQQYSVDLQREIDDADKRELEDVKRMIDNGELWYPLF